MDDDDIFFDADAAIETLARELLSGVKRADFQHMAHRLSAGIELGDLDYLESRFHSPPREPDDYDHRKHGLGGWLSACQFATFELIYQLGANATPMLRRIAWGEYDWTQGNAIELLIRFAASGIEAEKTAAEIATMFPEIRHEAKLYSIEPLIPMARDDPALAAFLLRLRREVPEFDKTTKDIEVRLSPP